MFVQSKFISAALNPKHKTGGNTAVVMFLEEFSPDVLPAVVLKTTLLMFPGVAVHHVGAEEGDGEVQGHRRGRAAEEAVGGGAAAIRG